MLPTPLSTDVQSLSAGMIETVADRDVSIGTLSWNVCIESSKLARLHKHVAPRKQVTQHSKHCAPTFSKYS